MIQKCEHCQREYEVGVSQTFCPHRPVSKKCEKHKRTNCGNCEQEQRGKNDSSNRILSNSIVNNLI